MSKFITLLETPIGLLKIEGNYTVVTSIEFLKNIDIAISNIQISEEAQLPTNILKCKHQLHEYFIGYRREFDFLAEQKGSPFQHIVWHQIKKIDYGETSTYLKQSLQIADEKIVRALGNANSKNKLLVVVPCHRVIGKNGDLVGYAGELWRKDWLLKHEAKNKYGLNSLFD